jgi:hypothetical protein
MALVDSLYRRYSTGTLLYGVNAGRHHKVSVCRRSEAGRFSRILKSDPEISKSGLRYNALLAGRATLAAPDDLDRQAQGNNNDGTTATGASGVQLAKKRCKTTPPATEDQQQVMELVSLLDDLNFTRSLQGKPRPL